MDIEGIKKKVLEDVDPELKRKKAREFGVVKTDDIKGKIIWFMGRP